MSAEACPHGCLPRSRCTDCSYHDTLKSADHGISPAQLREKVEALERRHEQALKMCAVCDRNTREAIEEVMSRLDAALKRIERLEANMQQFSALWQEHPKT